jgi:hypothetical protein
MNGGQKERCQNKGTFFKSEFTAVLEKMNLMHKSKERDCYKY